MGQDEIAAARAGYDARAAPEERQDSSVRIMPSDRVGVACMVDGTRKG
ncbi:hypothetical protein ACFW9O_04040 [Streptomyces sp. NPDC059499]